LQIRINTPHVIPAEAGIQKFQRFTKTLDTGVTTFAITSPDKKFLFAGRIPAWLLCVKVKYDRLPIVKAFFPISPLSGVSLWTGGNSSIFAEKVSWRRRF
jgi:hypothetical protein